MNPRERAARTTNPGEQIRAGGSPSRDEDMADAQAVREALAEIRAGAGTVPADQVWAELIPDWANDSDQETGER